MDNLMEYSIATGVWKELRSDATVKPAARSHHCAFLFEVRLAIRVHGLFSRFKGFRKLQVRCFAFDANAPRIDCYCLYIYGTGSPHCHRFRGAAIMVTWGM